MAAQGGSEQIQIEATSIFEVIVEGLRQYYQKHCHYPGHVRTYVGALRGMSLDRISRPDTEFLGMEPGGGSHKVPHFAFSQTQVEADRSDQRVTLEMDTTPVRGFFGGIRIYEDPSIQGKQIIFERGQS